MHPYIQSIQNYEDQLAGWFKSLLGISSATLAILVSLMPETEIIGVSKYSLIVCWVSLASTIFFTLIASYRTVNKAMMEFAVTTNQIFKDDAELLKKGNKMIKRGKWVSKLIGFSQLVAVISFAVSFISLAIFAIARTL